MLDGEAETADVVPDGLAPVMFQISPALADAVRHGYGNMWEMTLRTGGAG
jgi:hypothetical protein